MASLDQKNTIVSNSQEDDSFFDYLNSLSPLNTKKYVGVGASETLNSLGMDYPLFTSLDVTSYDESIFLIRNNNLLDLDTSNPEVSFEDVNNIHSHEEAPTDSIHAWIDISELHDPLISSDDAKYLLELLDKQEPDGTDVQDVSVNDAVEGGTYIQEGPDCDYNNLISTTQYVTLLPQSNSNSNYKMQAVDPVAFGSKHEIKENPSEPIAATDRNQTRDNLANVSLMDSNPIKRGDDELARIRRSIQRSCQGYESKMTSLQRNNSVYTSNISSCTTKSDERNAINLNPNKNPSDSQKCVLQGSGFYWNALPSLNHYEGIENEKMSSRRKPESPSCIYSLHISARQGYPLSQLPAPIESHLQLSKNEDVTNSSVHIPGEDFCQSTPKRTSEVQSKDLTNKQLDQNMKKNMKVRRKGPIDLVSSGSEHEKEEESAEFSQSIPKRKRKVLTPKFDFASTKSDLTRKGGACKHCNCKKSMCLKLYCECIAAGVYCTGPCSCQDCLNKPLAFIPKVVRSSDSSPQIVEDPNKKGCNCNKSSCKKKYCECFKGGVGCSPNPSCKCEGCENIYGRKGSSEAETKYELEETQASQISRPLLPLPYSSIGKPQRSCA